MQSFFIKICFKTSLLLVFVFSLNLGLRILISSYADDTVDEGGGRYYEGYRGDAVQ